ncbi:MAG TPA: LacI family DNA-binding transcriptional regulator, partial [Bacillota bacterium]|nr:LacI family DNA-binding transcriptional regulator [Bacillota bacterium]
MKDIARVAGVSVTTVSKVLNNRGDEFGISQETQKRVREIARQMNYQPHKEARNLRLGKRYSSILFLSLYEGRTKGAEGFFSHPFFGELMHQIQAEVSRSGCYLSYVAVTEESMPAVRTLIQDRISGVVTCGTMSPELAKLLQRSRLPVAAIEPYTSPAGAFHEVYVD